MGLILSFFLFFESLIEVYYPDPDTNNLIFDKENILFIYLFRLNKLFVK